MEKIKRAPKDVAPNRITDKNKEAVKRLKSGAGTNMVNGNLNKFYGSSKPEPGLEDFEEDNLKIWSWNINGIRPSMAKNIIQSFITKHNPTILCINETKIDSETLSNLNLKKNIPKEYVQIWNCCKPPIKGYSGTAIFTKVKPIKIIKDLGIPEHDCEGRTITCEFKKFFLVCTYVPNSSQMLRRLDYRVNSWDVAFREFVMKLESTGKPVIIAGDLNVAHHDKDIHDPKSNLKNPGFTVEERNSFSEFLDFGYIDTFRHFHPDDIKYSYWSVRTGNRLEDKGWRLDYFVISKDILSSVIESEIHCDEYGSDHCPISFDFKLKDINLDEFKENSQHCKNSTGKDKSSKDKDGESKQEIKHETKEEIKEEVKEEIKKEVKQEIH